MPGRVTPFQTSVDGMSDGSASYRYGFNGKENDFEPKNSQGSQQDYGMRIYDPRLGKFLSVDPLASEYSWNSSYSFAENDVIRCIDLDGSEKSFVTMEPACEKCTATMKTIETDDIDRDIAQMLVAYNNLPTNGSAVLVYGGASGVLAVSYAYTKNGKVYTVNFDKEQVIAARAIAFDNDSQHQKNIAAFVETLEEIRNFLILDGIIRVGGSVVKNIKNTRRAVGEVIIAEEGAALLLEEDMVLAEKISERVKQLEVSKQVSSSVIIRGELKYDQRTLQHMYSKHSKDFGITKSWSKSAATEFEGILNSHIQKIEPIQGTYRGTQKVYHYFDSKTGLNVMTDTDGNLIGGWKLSADQIKYLQTTGAVK